MTAAVDPLRLDLLAELDCVAAARHAVTDYAKQVGVVDVAAVALSVSEAITNAVLHGCRDGEAQRVLVVAEKDQQQSLFIVTVEDHGGGMRPRADSPGLGLGLPIMAHLAQHFAVHPVDGGGTRVRLSFPTS